MESPMNQEIEQEQEQVSQVSSETLKLKIVEDALANGLSTVKLQKKYNVSRQIIAKMLHDAKLIYVTETQSWKKIQDVGMGGDLEVIMTKISELSAQFFQLENRVNDLVKTNEKLNLVVLGPSPNANVNRFPLSLDDSTVPYLDYPAAPVEESSKTLSVKIGHNLHENFFQYCAKFEINKADILESYIYYFVNKLKSL